MYNNKTVLGNELRKGLKSKCRVAVLVVCVCVCACALTPVKHGSKSTTCGSWFFPSTLVLKAQTGPQAISKYLYLLAEPKVAILNRPYLVLKLNRPEEVNEDSVWSRVFQAERVSCTEAMSW